jgi:hypothetical protein
VLQEVGYFDFHPRFGNGILDLRNLVSVVLLVNNALLDNMQLFNSLYCLASTCMLIYVIQTL